MKPIIANSKFSFVKEHLNLPEKTDVEGIGLMYSKTQINK